MAIETVHSITPALAVLVSMVASVLILAFGKYPNIREGWTFVAAFIKFSLVISMLPLILEGKVITYTVIEMLPNLPIAFKVDAFGILFAITSSFLWIFVSSYSIGYMRTLKEHAQTRYYFCFAIALSSAIGIAFSANLVTLFLFYELLTISRNIPGASGQIPMIIDMIAVNIRGISMVSGASLYVSSLSGFLKNATYMTGKKYAAFSTALIRSTPIRIMLSSSAAPSSRYHLVIYPPTGGIPIIPSAPTVNASMVMGICLAIPFISLIFSFFAVTIKAPAHMNSVIFINAWYGIWSIPPVMPCCVISTAPNTTYDN